jgi:DNA-binding transcriptional regulator YiaG
MMESLGIIIDTEGSEDLCRLGAISRCDQGWHSDRGALHRPTGEACLTPRSFSPDEVKKVRSMMGVSQPIFGQFLGVDVKTVRSWEQGRRVPSGMARRFPEEIQAAPEHWRSRLRAVLGDSRR